MTTWPATTAKAKFSEVLDRASSEGPQLVSRRGKGNYILLTEEEWKARAPVQRTGADFWLNSPLRGSGLKLPRRKWRSRKLEL